MRMKTRAASSRRLSPRLANLRRPLSTNALLTAWPADACNTSDHVGQPAIGSKIGYED